MKYFLWLLLLGSGLYSQAQYHPVFRFIRDDRSEPVLNVTVYLEPGHKGFLSDSAGYLFIPQLSPGRYRIDCSAIGFQSREYSFSIPAKDSLISITMEPAIVSLDEVVVASTRTGRQLKNTPVAVQVIDREDIDEGTAQSPANIRELLTELSGTQMQQTSAVSGNVSIRLQGLDGRYTQLLKDGFPLYGGFSGSLSLLQVPPLDLKQVEVIRGTGSSLYGSDGIAGIINLISRQPDTSRQLNAILNQTNRAGTDMGVYYSHRNKKTGFTMMGTASHQSPADVNDDGFSDFPRVWQGSLAPTFYWYPDDSTSFRLGVHVSGEQRTGGDMLALKEPPDVAHPFLQENRSQRDYYQLSLIHKSSRNRVFTLKNSISYFYRSIRQTRADNGNRLMTADFSGSEIASFTEASYSQATGSHQYVLGAVVQTDQFNPQPPGTGLGYTYRVPGLFVQDDWTVLPNMVIEAGMRSDFFQKAYLLPRMAILYRPADRLSLRLGAGLAYKLPTIFQAAEEEAVYQQVYPISRQVKPEHSIGANFSIQYHGQLGSDISYSLTQDFYYTRLRQALIADTDSLQNGWIYYVNAPGDILSYGSETMAMITAEDISISLNYHYNNSGRMYLPGKPRLPLTPRNRITASFMYESEPHWKIGAETFYTGRQSLDNGEETRPFTTIDFLAQYRWRNYALQLNLENLTDIRQSRFGTLYSGTVQDPVFKEIYAPTEGRVISVSLQYRL